MLNIFYSFCCSFFIPNVIQLNSKSQVKNPAYGRQSISQPMRIDGPIPPLCGMAFHSPRTRDAPPWSTQKNCMGRGHTTHVRTLRLLDQVGPVARFSKNGSLICWPSIYCLTPIGLQCNILINWSESIYLKGM